MIGNVSLFICTVSGGCKLQRVNVDWAYNILYWIEIKGGTSTIHRLGLDGGVSEQVDLPRSWEIRDIFLIQFMGEDVHHLQHMQGSVEFSFINIDWTAF